MKRYRVNVGGHAYDVEIEDVRVRPVVARIGSETFLVDVESEATAERQPTTAAAEVRPARAAAPAAGHRGRNTLPAPIPGVVISVTVVAGQAVERGDALLTIEAMKMFNVIRSPRAGTITTVHVAERAHVAQGDILVTYGS